jgi:plasmid stability protein
MAALTVRNLSPEVVRSLKALARRNGRSMEQQARELLESDVADRLSALRQIEASWAVQARRPRAREVDRWIAAGRP